MFFYRICKFFLVSIITVIIVWTIISCALSSNIAHKYFISYLQKICVKNDISLNIESVQNIFIESKKNNWKLQISGVKFTHMCFLPPFSLKIDKINFVKQNNENKQNCEQNNQTIKDYIEKYTDQYKNYIRNNKDFLTKINFVITKIFKQISVNQCIIRFDKKQYTINNSLYEFDYWNNVKIFNCEIENYVKINSVFDNLIKIDILGSDKYEAYKAELLAIDKSYCLKISNNKIPFSVTLDGKFNKNANGVSPFYGVLCCNDYKIDIKGEVDIAKYLIHINFYKVFDIAKHFLEKTIKNKIESNKFDNVDANIGVNIDLLNFKNSLIITQFINEKLKNNILSELKITFDKNFDILLNGSMNWLNIYGFYFSKINCSLKNKNINFNLSDKNFYFQTTATINDNLQINNATFKTEKTNINLKGTVHDLKNIDLDINFASNDLSIFDKISSGIKGDIKGTFKYKQNKIFGNFKSKQLSLDRYVLFNSKGEINDENFTISILQCNAFGKRCNNVNIISSNNNINLSLKFNQNENFFCNFKKQNNRCFEKLSIVSGGIRRNELFLKFDKGELDFSKKIFKLQAVMLNTEINKQYGLIDIIYGLNEIKLKVNNLYVQKVFDIFEKKYINGILNIDTNLNCLGQDIIGDINCNFQDTTTNKRLAYLNIICNKDISEIKGTICCKNQKLDLKATLPITIKKDCIQTHKFLQKLSIELKGKIDIKNLYEFKESVDLRGIFASDVTINGSFASPKINGYATIENSDFNIYGVLLSRGHIAIEASNSDTLYVKNACFIDSKKNNLIIKGIGKLFFDNFIPNIQTNLDFIFQNYRLFDSDELIVILSGNGKMTGPINKLNISGNVDVHDCIISDILTDDININDIEFIDKKAFYNKYTKQINHKKDFISYDVSMKCKKIKLYGNIYNITMFGDLLLTTNNGKVSLQGNTKLKKGYIDFFGKRIPINRGIANFEKQYPFNPEAQFICNKNFGDISVKLNIINSPTKGGNIILSSIPYNTNDIILSKVLFGKEIQHLTFPEAAQLANAVHNIKNRGGLLSIMNSFKKIGIIDTISFSSSTNQYMLSGYKDKNSTNQKTNISAGKYIGDNLFVSINKNDDNVTLDLDYSLTPTISVKANSIGETGVSWKYRY